MGFVAETEEKLQENVNEYQKELSAINMEININKNKTVIMANEIKEHKIEIIGTIIRTSQKLQISRNTNRIQW